MGDIVGICPETSLKCENGCGLGRICILMVGPVSDLRAALSAITDRYCDLSRRAGCGPQDPEDEDEVKQARAVLLLSAKGK